MLCITFSEKKICSTIKKFQSIIKMVLESKNLDQENQNQEPKTKDPRPSIKDATCKKLTSSTQDLGHIG